MKDVVSLIESRINKPTILENPLGKWTKLGIFIKEDDEYAFLNREYSNPKLNGGGNMVLSTTISTEDNLIKKSNSIYEIEYKMGGATAIYDEDDSGFERYNKMLTASGITPFPN